MTQDFVGIAVSLYQKEQNGDRTGVFQWLAKSQSFETATLFIIGSSGLGEREVGHSPRFPPLMLGWTRFNFYDSYGFSSFLLQSPNIRNVDDIDAIDAIDDIDDMEYNHDDIHRVQKCLDDFDMSSLLPCWAMRFQCLVVSA